MEATETKKEPLISFPEPWKPELCFGLYLFAMGYAFNFFGLWIKFGFSHKQLESEYEGWYVSYKNSTLMLNWGTKAANFFMPWDLVMTKCDVLTRDQTWSKYRFQKFPHFSKLMNPNLFNDDRAMFEAPYRYLTKNNKVQATTAVFYVTRSAFKWRILKSLPIGTTKTRIDLRIVFKSPIGEHVGTWRGGTQRAIWEILDCDQSPFHALNRMNRERKFG